MKIRNHLFGIGLAFQGVIVGSAQAELPPEMLGPQAVYRDASTYSSQEQAYLQPDFSFSLFSNSTLTADSHFLSTLFQVDPVLERENPFVASSFQTLNSSTISTLPSELRDELTAEGFTPLLIEGDYNGDGRVDVQDLLQLTASLTDGHEPSICEILAGDVNNDGDFNYGDLESLQALFELYEDAPASALLLRGMRGTAEGCSVFGLTTSRVADRLVVRALQADVHVESLRQVDESGSGIDLVRVPSEGADKVFRLHNTSKNSFLELRANGNLFLLPLAGNAVDRDALASETAEQRSDEEIEQENIRIGKNSQGYRTIWSSAAETWERIPPSDISPSPVPKATRGCSLGYNGHRAGTALILQLVSDWRLDGGLLNWADEYRADRLDSDFFEIVKAAIGANYQVVSRNIASSSRIRSKPERLVTCRGIDAQGKRWKTEILSATAALGGACVAHSRADGSETGRGGLSGVITKESRTISEQQRLEGLWIQQKNELGKSLAENLETFQERAGRFQAGIFVYVAGHGLPGLNGGTWNDGLGMISLERAQLLQFVGQAARNGEACNFTFIDHSCFGFAPSYGRNRGSSCEDRPARWEPVEENETRDVVSVWLSAADPFRIATGKEIHARSKELIQALKATTEVRLNRALRALPGGTGEYGDAYYNGGYNDPNDCY